MHTLTSSQLKKQAQSYAWLLLVRTMNEKLMSYTELSKRLQALGVREQEAVIARRIHRKSFSASFFLLCLKAMAVREVDIAALQLTQQGHERLTQEEKTQAQLVRTRKTLKERREKNSASSNR